MEPYEIAAFNPVNFFQLAVDCLQLPAPKKNAADFVLDGKNFAAYRLPSTTELTNDPSFAEVALGWRLDGVEACVKVARPFNKVCYPQVHLGDSVELFIDTRDIKTSGYNTRFCHHFFFLPEALEGRQAGELTRFRSEDAHELCDPDELRVKSVVKKNEYTLHVFIPATCLQGYDPDQFGRLGFTYRINHAGYSQHFSVVTQEYQLEQQPSLWSSLRLIK